MSCSAKTTGDNAHYPQCAACRPTRRAGIVAATTFWKDPVGLSALLPEAAAVFTRDDHGWPRLVTGAPLPKACCSAAEARLWRGEPAGAPERDLDERIPFPRPATVLFLF